MVAKTKTVLGRALGRALVTVQVTVQVTEVTEQVTVLGRALVTMKWDLHRTTRSPGNGGRTPQ